MIPCAHFLPAKLIRRMIRPYRAIGGFLTEGEAVELFRCANRLPAKATVIEIGSWKGKSTFCLARGLRPGGQLHAIDPFDGAGEPGSAETYARERKERPLRTQFEENTAPVGPRITIHQGYSREFVDKFPGIDLLLIDGDHSIDGARFDFEHFGPQIVPGGWVAFHDYYPDRAELGPTWVIDHLVKPGGQFNEFHVVDSLWVGRKT
jgi:hypothetical protein